MIIGTAGHVDHGKTSLVKALTGIDTDRLPEEKRRGITLELGFAHLALPDGTVAGVVDVPGHERFVKAMAAGAGGVDLAILVVAADDGVIVDESLRTSHPDVYAAGDLDGDGAQSTKQISYVGFGHSYQLVVEDPEQGAEDQGRGSYPPFDRSITHVALT